MVRCRRLQQVRELDRQSDEIPVQDALLYYGTLPGITPAVATKLRNSK
jgi:hypothetical protein